jgi:predicted metal-dependent phosphoesterase TrpH
MDVMVNRIERLVENAEIAIMSSELESILQQAQQLDSQERSLLMQQLVSHAQSGQKEESVNPWLATAGSLVDDPFFDDYVSEIEKYRKEVDEIEGENSVA